MKKVLIVFGGKSAEHEVSFWSAKNVVAALDRKLFEPILVGISKEGSWYQFPSEQIFDQIQALTDNKVPATGEPVALVSHQGRAKLFQLKTSRQIDVDVAFPVLHGTFGEDGTIQGYFKIMNLAFVGCGVLSSAAGMDKEFMKRLLVQADIPTSPWVLLTPQAKSNYAQLSQTLGSPFFIKPANAGSSVGVFKIKTEQDFDKFLPLSMSYDEKVLAEKFIAGREIECSVLGPNHEPRASTPGEIIPHHEFYSYEAKYLDEKGATAEIPAKISADACREIQKLAIKTYQVMGCEGMTRVDFFLTQEGRVFVNEINTIPGFTKISMYPKMWEASGLGYQGLVTELINLGLKTFERQNSLQTQLSKN